MMTKEKSYPQRLLARATDRERSFLRRSAWMLGYILLGIAMILCAMLWLFVKGLFQELWKTRPEPEPESLDDLPFYDPEHPHWLLYNNRQDDD